MSLLVSKGFLLSTGEKREATIRNLAEHLRQENADLNIVVSPEAADIVVSDLNLRRADIRSVMDALTIATDGAVRGNTLGGDGNRNNNWALLASSSRSRSARTVEVFNLGGYFQQLGSGEKEIGGNLQQLQEIIAETINELKRPQQTAADQPSFRFHSGANLFVVTGTPEALEVARKVISALPGAFPNQQGSPGTRNGDAGMAPAFMTDPVLRLRYMERYGISPLPSGSGPVPTDPRRTGPGGIGGGGGGGTFDGSAGGGFGGSSGGPGRSFGGSAQAGSRPGRPIPPEEYRREPQPPQPDPKER